MASTIRSRRISITATIPATSASVKMVLLPVPAATTTVAGDAETDGLPRKYDFAVSDEPPNYGHYDIGLILFV